MPNQTVLIADDHPLIIQGLKEMLVEAGGFSVVGTFDNGRTLVESFELRQADILLLDLNIPGMDGLAVLERLQQLPTRPKTVVISSYHSPALIGLCRERDAAAYVVKTNDLQDIASIIKRVLAGETVFPNMPTQDDPTPLNAHFSESETFTRKFKLTPRELEIIRLICQNLNAKEIGERLYLSAFTVQTHRRNVLKKLNLHGNTSSNMPLYQFAKEHGII